MPARRCVLTVAGLALTIGSLTLPSCSSIGSDAAPTNTESATSQAAAGSSATDTATSTHTSTEVPVPAGLVGGGCGEYALKVPGGPGSLDGMAPDPVAVAISNSPQLTTLSSALSGKLNSEVNLAATLNTDQYTVFAPIDDAWGRLAPETLEKLRADSMLLTSILSYHVVSGQLPPDQVAGEHKTIQGGVITVSGSGDDLKVNNATVVCGGIRTSNAVLYLVDTVLTPPAPAPPGAPGSNPSTATTSSTADGTGSASSTDTTSSTSTSTTSTSSTTSSTATATAGSPQMSASAAPTQ